MVPIAINWRRLSPMPAAAASLLTLVPRPGAATPAVTIIERVPPGHRVRAVHTDPRSHSRVVLGAHPDRLLPLFWPNQPLSAAEPTGLTHHEAMGYAPDNGPSYLDGEIANATRRTVTSVTLGYMVYLTGYGDAPVIH